MPRGLLLAFYAGLDGVLDVDPHCGGTGLHEALHGRSSTWPMGVLERVWCGTNAYDKVGILVASAGAACVLSD